MLRLSRDFGKRENVSGMTRGVSDAVQRAFHPTNGALAARTQFQAFKTGGYGDADLALHAERL